MVGCFVGDEVGQVLVMNIFWFVVHAVPDTYKDLATAVANIPVLIPI